MLRAATTATARAWAHRAVTLGPPFLGEPGRAPQGINMPPAVSHGRSPARSEIERGFPRRVGVGYSTRECRTLDNDARRRKFRREESCRQGGSPAASASAGLLSHAVRVGRERYPRASKSGDKRTPLDSRARTRGVNSGNLSSERPSRVRFRSRRCRLMRASGQTGIASGVGGA